MNHVTRAPIVIAVFWAACAHGAPLLEPPSDATLLDLTYSGVAQQPVALRDGRWQGEPFVPGGASRQRVELVRDFRRDGDLDGDGRVETIVILSETSGGSGVVSYLAVVGFRDGAWRNVGTALLGDRVQLRDARIAERRVELDLVQAGPGDAACCPSQLATRVFALEDGGLREIGQNETGTLSIATLAANAWRLSHLPHSPHPEPAPAEPAITLAVAGTRLSGSSGCNRYFASIEPGDSPGELKIGPVAGTRMACPGDAMALETRYLAALQTVTGYGFLNGRLALRGQKDGQPQLLLFERQPAEAP